MKSKTQILNEMISNAADIMEGTVEFQKILIGILEDKREKESMSDADFASDKITINSLKAENEEILHAIAVMRKHKGSWYV